MRLNDGCDIEQSESGPFAELFCREEWIVDLFDDSGRDTDTRICNGDAAVRSDLCVDVDVCRHLVENDIVRTDLQPAASGHRIAGIDTEIQEHLMHLCGIGKDGEQFTRREEFGPYHLRECFVDQAFQFTDDMLHLNDHCILLIAGESENLFDQVGTAEDIRLEHLIDLTGFIIQQDAVKIRK